MLDLVAPNWSLKQLIHLGHLLLKTELARAPESLQMPRVVDKKWPNPVLELSVHLMIDMHQLLKVKEKLSSFPLGKASTSAGMNSAGTSSRST